jgi:hypothetical protein
MLAGPPPTEAEVRQVFEEVLAGYARGEEPPVISCYGFDAEAVTEALRRVRAAAPSPPPELVHAARAAFNRMLGSTE